MSFRPSSGVQDCTYSNRPMSNRYWCLPASGFPASKQTAVQQYSFELLMVDGKTVRTLASSWQYLFDTCLLLYVQSWTPDDGRKDSPKHVECDSKQNKFETLVHLVGFAIEILQFSSHNVRPNVFDGLPRTLQICSCSCRIAVDMVGKRVAGA